MSKKMIQGKNDVTATTTIPYSGEIGCLYYGIDAIVEVLQDKINKTLEDKRDRDVAYGLTMALQLLNDQIGEKVGAI